MNDQDISIKDRLRQLVRQSGSSQAEFSRRIGIDPSNLSKSLNSPQPVGEALINRIVAELGINKQWILSGTGAVRDEKRPVGAPVYDVDITAGPLELPQAFSHENIIGHISLPQVSPECPVVRVSGDSMVPVIQNGSLVSIRRVHSLENIFWGQIYVVVLDDYRMVKYVRRNYADPSRVILHSANADYDDMDIALSDIRSMFLVETVINFDRRC